MTVKRKTPSKNKTFQKGKPGTTFLRKRQRAIKGNGLVESHQRDKNKPLMVDGILNGVYLQITAVPKDWKIIREYYLKPP
jgi:hypothetical protein